MRLTVNPMEAGSIGGLGWKEEDLDETAHVGSTFFLTAFRLLMEFLAILVGPLPVMAGGAVIGALLAVWIGHSAELPVELKWIWFVLAALIAIVQPRPLALENRLIGRLTVLSDTTRLNAALRLGATASVIAGCVWIGRTATSIVERPSFDFPDPLFVALGLWGLGFGAQSAFAAVLEVRADLRALKRAVDVGAIRRSDRCPEHRISVVHWSDLHVGESLEARTLEGLPCGNRALDYVAEAVAAQANARDILLITGDITDSGTPKQWGEFFDRLAKLPRPLRDRVVLVPGNHDINIPELREKDGRTRASNAAIEWAYSVYWGARVIRMLAAMDALHGTRSYVGLGETRMTLREHLASHADDVRRYLECAPLSRMRTRQTNMRGDWESRDVTAEDVKRLRSLPLRLWATAFPLVVELPLSDESPQKERLRIVVLDSVRHATNIAENAFGYLQPAAIDALREILDPTRHPTIVALHHHLAYDPRQLHARARQAQGRRWRRVYNTYVQPSFLRLENATDLLHAVGDRGRLVFFHGHRHLFGRARIGQNVQVVSAPSTTLGDSFDPHHRAVYHRIELGWSSGVGTWVISDTSHASGCTGG